jgi:hypothetical protein
MRAATMVGFIFLGMATCVKGRRGEGGKTLAKQRRRAASGDAGNYTAVAV